MTSAVVSRRGRRVARLIDVMNVDAVAARMDDPGAQALDGRRQLGSRRGDAALGVEQRHRNRRHVFVRDLDRGVVQVPVHHGLGLEDDARVVARGRRILQFLDRDLDLLRTLVHSGTHGCTDAERRT